MLRTIYFKFYCFRERFLADIVEFGPDGEEGRKLIYGLYGPVEEILISRRLLRADAPGKRKIWLVLMSSVPVRCGPRRWTSRQIGRCHSGNLVYFSFHKNLRDLSFNRIKRWNFVERNIAFSEVCIAITRFCLVLPFVRRQLGSPFSFVRWFARFASQTVFHFAFCYSSFVFRFSFVRWIARRSLR